MKSLLSVLLIVTVLALDEGLAQAQQPGKVPRIGFLNLGSPYSSTYQFQRQVFISGLLRLGYTEGKNIVIEYRHAYNLENLTHLATELVRLDVSLIVATSATIIVYAMKATKTIPIVMAGGTGNVVRRGYVESLTRPGGNVTGLSSYLKGAPTKRMELFKETLPSISRVAVLHPRRAKGAVMTYNRVGKALGMEVQAVEFRGGRNIEKALSSIAVMRPDALITIGTPRRRNEKIAQFTLKTRLPSMHNSRRLAILGGLMSYDVSRTAIYSRAAVYVDKILKGANPATLPVESPRFELLINLKTAKKIGVTIPPEILLEANHVIN